MVETQNKMGGGESLQVSVSFGKYENDAALSWEKWSTFSSPNKYLEEVGKCSTPGSVAQKKAFFEAHYKKIAAMKLAQEEQEQELLILDQQNQINKDDNDEQPPPIHDGSARLTEQEPVVNNDQEEEDDSLPSESPIVISFNSTAAAAADKLEEAALVNAESMKLVQQHFQVDLHTQPQIDIMQHKPQKINPKEEEKNAIGMKKQKKKQASNKQTNIIPLKASLILKTPETPATRLSKPKPKPKESSTSSLKKASAPSSSKNNNQSLSETRRVTPILSMSMNSDTASSVTSSRRRSLFMEQMGDKDIVKRAFKTFQNRVNQLPSSDNYGPKQLPTKRSEQKTWKENERSRKTAAAAEKMNPARGQSGPAWKSVSSGSLKGVGVDERRLKAGPTSVALKSQERSERRKEFFKNLEEKSNARVAERSQLSLKSKEVKDTEIKTVRQKAKPMPKAQGVLKSA